MFVKIIAIFYKKVTKNFVIYKKSSIFVSEMKKINKAYKFRLYPNKSQVDLLERHFGCVRFVYNYFLNQRKEAYRLTGKSSNYYEQAKMLTELKKEETTIWLNEVNAQSLQHSLRNLEAAYTNFFKRRARFPHFKSKRSKNTFTVPQHALIADGKLFISKFKEGIKCHVHREINGNIGKVVVSKTPSGKYFVSVFVEEDYDTPYIKTGKSVGVDMGLKDLIITSEGDIFKNNRYIKKYERKLARAQRHLSRKNKGSRGYENQRLKVAMLHEKVANSRYDYLHKCSASLVREYDTICVEDLDIKSMEKSHRLAKSITDASWGKFVDMLIYKAKWNDKNVVKIDRYFPSSQTCSVCGYINKQTKDLSVREWECPVCHTFHNRDINSAINILRFGLNNISAGTVDYTSREGVRVDHLGNRPSEKPETDDFFHK